VCELTENKVEENFFDYQDKKIAKIIVDFAVLFHLVISKKT